MKKRKYLETDFIKFLKEKYSENEEEEKLYPNPDDENDENRVEEDEEEKKEIDEGDKEEILEELVKEYKNVRKEYHDLLLHKHQSGKIL